MAATGGSETVIVELELLKFQATMDQLKGLSTALVEVNKAMTGTGRGTRSNPTKPVKPKKPELTWQEKTMKALMSSRFGTSGGMMPLVGQTAAIFGKFGPVVLAAAVALKALTDITVDAAEQMKKAANEYYSTGGTPGELGTADSVSRMTGDDIAGHARAFQQNILGGGMPTAWANSHGITDTPGMPEIDALKNYLKYGRLIADPHAMSQAQAMREVQANRELEPFLKLRDLSDQTRGDVLNRMNDKMFSPEQRRSAEEYAATLSGIQTEWDKAKNMMAAPIIEAIGALGRQTHGFEGASEIFNPNYLQDHLTYLVRYLTARSEGLSDEEADKMTDEMAKGDVEEKAIAATQETTDAIKELSQIMREGIYGGGQRARGALPGMYRGANGNATERFLENSANALGAFGIGT